MQRALAEEQLTTQSHTQLLSSYQWLCLQSLHGNVASGAYDQCTPRFSGRILHGSNWTRWRLLLHGLATCFHYLQLLCSTLHTSTAQLCTNWTWLTASASQHLTAQWGMLFSLLAKWLLFWKGWARLGYVPTAHHAKSSRLDLHFLNVFSSLSCSTKQSCLQCAGAQVPRHSIRTLEVDD